MSLQKNQISGTFVNIKEGSLVVKKKDGNLESYDSLEGIIEKVEFITEEYEGKKIEKAKFFVNDIGEIFILQIKVNKIKYVVNTKLIFQKYFIACMLIGFCFYLSS